MTFRSPFGKAFSPPFEPNSLAVATGVVVCDEFTDTDATLLTNHTPNLAPSGVVWEDVVSTGIIYSNRAQMSFDGFAVIDSKVADCIITAKLLSSYASSGIDSRQSGIIFRYDGTDYWKVTINVQNDKFYIRNPSGSVVAEKSINLIEYTLYVLAVTLNGNSIKATLDGDNEITYFDSTNATATKHGFGLFRRSYTSYCDDFTVESL